MLPAVVTRNPDASQGVEGMSGRESLDVLWSSKPRDAAERSASHLYELQICETQQSDRQDIFAGREIAMLQAKVERAAQCPATVPTSSPNLRTRFAIELRGAGDTSHVFSEFPHLVCC
jgi:hypothetical protein